ncbi:SgcJ/EcaC family oxidoreductase [Undibacterium sp. TJN25]|uniref:SgcJ/EcaC family oxidoreductase n=1 Tax=Undibacterium sp. TJN25 TaxID=3413056 RepID=UPI003BF433C4
MKDSEQQMHAQVYALYRRMLEGWNTRDAALMAAQFAPDGISIGFDGSQMSGQDEISSTLQQIFAQHATPPFVHKLKSVRLLTPEVALLCAIAGMAPPGKSELEPSLNAVQTIVAQLCDGQWRISQLQNTPAALHGRPELVQQMTAELKDAMHLNVH